MHDGTDEDAQLWQISENLHRAELTAQERAEHIAEWVRLTEGKQKGNPEAQVAPLELGYKKPPPQKAGGINAAVRELGIDRTEAQRAVKIAAIAPEAKVAAREAGLVLVLALVPLRLELNRSPRPRRRHMRGRRRERRDQQQRRHP